LIVRPIAVRPWNASEPESETSMIRSERSSWRMRRRAVAVLSAALLAAVAFPAPEVGAASNDPAGVTITDLGGDGSSATPFAFKVEIDCPALATGSNRSATLAQGEVGKYYRFEVSVSNFPPVGEECAFYTATVPGASGPARFDVLPENTAAFLPARIVEFGSTVSAPVLLDQQFLSGVQVFELTLWGNPDFSAGQVVSGIRTTLTISGPTSGSGNSGSSGDSAVDPAAAAVATAVAQSNAAGIAGTSGGLLVRGGEVVPVVSSLASGVGPRGGVVLEAEGLSVSVASAVGARAGSGVVVPEGGSLQCSLCGDFVPGSVVEAWVNSDPRLAAAVAIPADAVDGDCHVLDVPTGAPLDGGGPIEAGAHTLQLRMDTKDGFAVLSTGITIGALTPTGVPAGDGPMPLSGVLGGLLVLLGAAALGLRSAASRGERACAGSAVIG
jgi:hypothetical protein